MTVKFIISRIEGLGDNILDKIEKRTVEIKKFIENQSRAMVQRISSDIKNTQADIASYMRDIYQKEEKLREYMILSERPFKMKIGELSLADLKSTLYSFIYNGKYTDINMYGNEISLYTPPVILRRHRKDFLIGKFQVKIDLYEKRIKFYNLDRDIPSGESSEGYQHPHIHNHVPCLGTYKEIMMKAMTEGDLITIITLTHDFLWHYNPSGPFRTLEKTWGKAGEDYCAVCDRIRVRCISHGGCVVCGKGVPKSPTDMNYCKCIKCPVDSVPLDRADCDNCEYHDKAKKYCKAMETVINY